MWRFLFWAFILIIGGAALTAVFERPLPVEEDAGLLLYRLMEVSGAEVLEEELHYWASLGEVPGVMARRELEERADELLGRLVLAGETVEKGEAVVAGETVGQDAVKDGGKDGGVEKMAAPDANDAHHGGSPLSKPEGGGVSEEELPLVVREEKLPCGAELLLQLQGMEQEGKNVLHLLLTVRGEGGPQHSRRLSLYAERIPSLLGAEVEKGSLSLSISGQLPEKMKPPAMEQLALEMISHVGGEQIRSVRDGDMVSVTGYTPAIEEYLQAEDLRVNLNVALRYDNYNGRTVVWAGTPLIARWY